MKNSFPRRVVAFVFLVALAQSVFPAMMDAGGVDARVAANLAGLALDCLHRKYPNKISHVLQSDEDIKAPRQLTPSFFGCYDWHSAVHGHWLLVRLARSMPEAEFAECARTAVAVSLAPERVAAEVEYLSGAGRVSFERPYGLAWLLQLAAEIREWNVPLAAEWSDHLEPLETAAAERIREWLPKLTHPIRVGEHSQTALAYEPSGQDFLSPCLAEADLVRRVLEPADHAAWLGGFLPGLPLDGQAEWLTPAVVTDPSDPKLVAKYAGLEYL